ncbi:MAG TPA: phosphoribosylamine--glycine ligase [Thermoanaerobaculia bacterium]|nr:phosphoribosylamine--glycine ligase [Thermoanaerobaculia bacterium]
MKVLVIGGGGREHALCWHLRACSPEAEVYCAPGSDGIAQVADVVRIAADEVHELADLARDLKIDLTIVGPELPLSLGVVDEFQNRGLRIFGPRKAAAQLESSKVFAKEFMRRHGIPTADFEVVHDAEEACAAAARFGLPVVLKADGLAAGKGVLLAHTKAELDDAIAAFFEHRKFGAGGDRVVVEQFLQGEEVSFIGLSDGLRLLPLATAKDYKRIGEGDIGPNTGGMGAHSPSGVADASTAALVLERVMHATVAGMAAEDNPFVGFLYAGLMLTDDGPSVLEFNVRLGDPEAQALLLRLEDDLARLLLRGARGDFETTRLDFKKEAAACLVLAAEGYPESAVKGARISGLDVAATHEGVEIFHAGTAKTETGWVVAGGRVLNVCASGRDLRHALRRAYDAARRIDWPGRQLRGDIGRRVLQAENIQHSGITSIPREVLGEESSG